MTIRQNGQILAGAVTGPYKANIDMDNLTDVGKNIANWSNNVTNCITEIPQDIKYEISNGHLILKAGSKVRFPNGSGVFDSYILPSDIDSGDVSVITEDYTFFMFYNKTQIGASPARNCYSGATAPTSSYGVFWYDTTNNTVKRYDGTSWVSGFSLPFAILGSGATSHQVFNGFGYIGSTVFALPGVKFSSLKGRNTDGTYITHTITNTSVKTYTRTSAWGNVCAYCDWNNDSNEVSQVNAIKDVIIVKKLPSSFQNYTTYINLEDGFTYYKGAEGIDIALSTKSAYKIATLSFGTNGTISDFNICSNVFSVINFQDSDLVSGWAMPSSRYIDLTLGASGATYTAPANGYIYFSKNRSGSSNQYAVISGASDGIPGSLGDGAQTDGYGVHILRPIKKGTTFKVTYTLTGATKYFRFVYAEGEPNV